MIQKNEEILHIIIKASISTFISYYLYTSRLAYEWLNK